jgi:3-isopropylmalate/(R)-2-methylmalate dehydratase large subunit
MNLIEKILARESRRPSVVPGDVVVVDVECALMHDLSARSARRVFEEQVGGEIAHPDRLVVVFDHLFSPPSEDRAEVLRATRVFCRDRGITLFDCGNGNLHQVAAQAGLIRPGALVVGSDSHAPVHGVFGAFSAWLGNDSYAATVMPFSRAWFRVPETIRIELVGETRPGTTARDVALWLTGRIGEGALNYQAIKFCGEYVDGLSVWDRWLLTLMAVDIGAKCAYLEPDATTEAFAASVGIEEYETVRDDPGTEFAATWRWDVGDIEPQLAVPPSVGNVHPVADFAGTRVDWAELGGHGGGRLDDVLMARDVIAARPKDPHVNFNVVPGTRHVFAEALTAGAVRDLHAGGATWFPPSTGANQALNMGAMADGESMISTHVRNFPGRNGSPKAEMYLGSALTVAASAAHGVITDPREML